MTDIVKKQKEALVAVIKESQKKEVKRLERLSQVKEAKDHELLEKRFNEERQREQERIENLTKDYQAVKERHQQGALSHMLDAREEFKKNYTKSLSSLGSQSTKSSRFTGLETHEDVVSSWDHNRLTIALI
jgi:hypothetical protein